MAKKTDAEAVATANMLWGPGWMYPIAIWLAGQGYVITAMPEIFFAELGVSGAVAGVVLIIKRNAGLSDDEGKSEFWVPIEYEDDEDD